MTITFFLRPWKFADQSVQTIDMHDFVPGSYKKKKKRRSRQIQEGLEALKLLDLQKEGIEAQLYKQRLAKNATKALEVEKRLIERQIEQEEEDLMILFLIEDI